MGKINADWHKANKMPKNPSIQERLKWHKAHAENCNCREMPEKLKELLNEKK